MTTINDKNYELWLVRYSDGELTGAERKAVEQWLEEHPDAAAELALYAEAPRMGKDDSVHYDGPIPGASRLLWPAILRWGAAAAVLIAAVLPFVFRQDEPIMPAEVAEVRREPAVKDAPVSSQISVETIVENEPYIAPLDDVIDEQANIYAEKPQPLMPRVIYVNNLIAYEEDDIYTEYDADLIVYDSGVVRNPGLKDILLAFSDAYSESSFGHLIGTIIKTNK